MTIDGFRRSPAEEARINEAVNEVFRTPSGELVLAYLQAITAAPVAPDSPTNAFIFAEGMRYVVHVLATRMRAHTQGVIDAARDQSDQGDQGRADRLSRRKDRDHDRS